MAIRALDWLGRMVGYVGSSDLPDAWRTLNASGRRSLRGRVCSVDVEHPCLLVHCEVETINEQEEVFQQARFKDWTYTGPVLKPTKEMMTLEYMVDELYERLGERKDWSQADRDNFVALTMKFCQLSVYDLSGDMDNYRRILSQQLTETADEVLIKLEREVRMASARCGRETNGGKVLDYWMKVLTEPKTMKSMMVYKDYDLEELRRQLEAFPEPMFREWHEDRDHFVGRLLYLRIPRQVLWQLVSGIAFYETMTARKPADEPLAATAATADEPDKKPLVNTVLKRNHNGRPMDFARLQTVVANIFVKEMKYGYEWFALWRVLYDLRLLEVTTLTAFAAQMRQWYPHVHKACCADTMGDYYNRYLGTTPFTLWDEAEFVRRKTSKQSVSGFRRLYNDCATLMEGLRKMF